MDVSPITQRYDLRCDAAEAFRVFTQRIGEWWDPKYTRDPATLVTVTIEPRVGGRVFATHTGFGEDDYGRVTEWVPGSRYAATSILAQPPDAPSAISVTFTPSPSGCAMHFEHGGWTEANVGFRSKFTDWRVLLDRFAALANRAP